MIDLENIKLPSNITFDGFVMNEWWDAPLFTMKVMDKEAEEEKTIRFIITGEQDEFQDGEDEWETILYPDFFQNGWREYLEVKDTLTEDTYETVTFENIDCDEYAEGSLTNEEAVQKILETLSKLSYSDIVA
jgi:hypothetical protein